MSSEDQYEIDKENRMRRLMQSIQGLAASAEQQLAIYPDFVCRVDELALDYDNWFVTVLSNDGRSLTEAQEQCLRELDGMLDAMSGGSNAALWTEEALRKRKEWEELRGVAKKALAAFGWKADPPPPSEDSFVSGEKQYWGHNSPAPGKREQSKKKRG